MSKSKKCIGKEGFQRINYLYQLANSHICDTQNNPSSYFYSNLAINVSKKTVQKLDLSIKRSICKGCRGLLIAGVTCKVRVKKKKIIWICSTCLTSRSYKISSHKLWLEQPESVVETLNYGVNEILS